MSKKHEDLGFVSDSYDDLGFEPDTSRSPAVEEGSLQDYLNTAEDLGRGGLQGVTLGFADEATGGIEALWEKAKGNPEEFGKLYKKHRDESRKAYKESEERSPTASFVGNLAGGVTTSLLPLGAAAKGAMTLGNAVKTGLVAGAVGGAGTSEAEDLPGIAADIGEGALLGAGTGGAMHGAVQGAKAIGKGVKGIGKFLGKTQLAKDNIDTYKLNREGIDTLTSEGLDKAEQSVREQTKNIAFGAKEARENAGKEIAAAKKLAKEKGFTVDTKEGIEKLKVFIKNAAESIDDREKQDAKIFQDLIDNLEQGTKKKVSYTEYTPQQTTSSKTIPSETVPYKPSAKEKLELELAKENASRRATGEPELKGTYTTSIDENGNKLLTLTKTVDEQIGAAERVTPIKEKGEVVDEIFDSGNSADNFVSTAKAKTVLDSPGTPEQIIPEQVLPGETIPAKIGNVVTDEIRSGGQDISNLSIEQANKVKKVLNTQNSVQGSPNLKTTEGDNLAKQVAGSIDESLRDFAPLAQANDKYAAASQAFDTFGIDPKTAFIKDPITKQPKLTVQAQQQLNNTIKRMARDTDAGENAAVKLAEGLRLLEGADPNIANALRPQVEKASRTLDLAQKAQRLGLLNKSTYLKSGSLYASGALGKATKGISDATPEYIKTVAKDLLSKGPNAMKLGSKLAEALKKDNMGRNAALFALQQDPNYRDMLKDYFSSDDKK